MVISSARIGYDIDNRRLAGFDHRNRALERRSEIFWIDDRTFAIHAETACDRGVIDIRIFDRDADSQYW